MAQVFFYEFCEISRNTFIYRTPPVAASVFVIFIVACSPILVPIFIPMRMIVFHNAAIKGTLMQIGKSANIFVFI